MGFGARVTVGLTAGSVAGIVCRLGVAVETGVGAGSTVGMPVGTGVGLELGTLVGTRLSGSDVGAAAPASPAGWLTSGFSRNGVTKGSRAAGGRKGPV